MRCLFHNSTSSASYAHAYVHILSASAAGQSQRKSRARVQSHSDRWAQALKWPMWRREIVARAPVGCRPLKIQIKLQTSSRLLSLFGHVLVKGSRFSLRECWVCSAGNIERTQPCTRQMISSTIDQWLALQLV